MLEVPVPGSDEEEQLGSKDESRVISNIKLKPKPEEQPKSRLVSTITPKPESRVETNIPPQPEDS